MNISMPRSRDYIILGLCIIIASLTFGYFFYISRTQDTTVKVVGFASKKFDSDVVKWHITINRNVGLNDVAKGYTQLAADRVMIFQQLQSAGIPHTDINTQPVNVLPSYGNNGTISGYSLTQTFFLISNNVATVETLALNPTSLFESGIIIQSSTLEYFSSKLAEIKHELLADATEDAKQRAEEITKRIGMSVDKMVSARAGVFQIKEPYSNEVSDYGIYTTSTKEKEITVTVSCAFAMK
ncbi:MAG: SIMPL domain-containing protein [Bacteroidota bacterium]